MILILILPLTTPDFRVDGLGGIRFDGYTTTYRIGSLALAIILFDGGLRTRRESFRGVLTPTMLLATVGVVIDEDCADR